MRNLTRSIAAMSLMVPAYAYPLGIGEIKLHSALNQKLDAEIALQLSSGESFSDIRVKIAPPEKYDELGVPWSYFLSQIEFETLTDNQGRSIVKLKTQEPLREPFLDLLLEVAWDKGSLFREFTVLVDPPSAYERPIVQVVSVPNEVETGTEKQVKAPDQLTDSTFPADVSKYGPTTRLDTLWKITEQLNQDPEISTEQFLIGLYNANQSAFYQPNINALMADQFLTVPPKAEILQTSAGEALAEFRKQDSAWNKTVNQSKAIPQIIDDTEVNAQLELQAPLADEVDQSKILVASDSVETTASGQNIDEPGLDVSDETLALQSRIEKLEEQLTMMQQILALKDAQIAALQVQNATTEPDLSADVAKESETENGVPVKVESTKSSNINKMDVQPETVKTPKEEPPKQDTTKPKPVKPKPVVQPEPETGFMSDYLTLVFGVTGAAILGVLGFYWWRRRYSAIEHEEEDTESMFASASEISLPVMEEESGSGVSLPVFEDDSSSYDVGTVGESSFLSEFTPSDFDAFDLDQNEVDPISEADVYLAYGRYQQAEDLMRQAIEDQPDRDECKLKLLEIFYANENKTEFETYVQELIQQGKNKNAAFWSKVTEMGRELDTNSSLFNVENQSVQQSVDVSESEGDSAPAEDELDAFTAEFNFDPNSESSLAEQSEPSDNDSSVTEDSQNHDLEFDLSIFDEAEGKAEEQSQSTETVHEVAEDEGLDFDLSAFDEKDEIEKEVVNEEQIQGQEQMETIDFDLDSLALESDNTGEIKNENALDLSGGEGELDSYNFELPSEEAEKSQNQAEEIDVGNNFDDFDFDFELELPESLKDSEQESNDGVSDLTDMDETETKIDLARAYIDMGDSDSAKSIIQEVLSNGNDKQKQVAQEILKQIG